MLPQSRLMILAFLLVSAGAHAADFGDAACPAGTKMKPQTVMCLPRDPRTWIVCTGFPNNEGEGLWKDTGVPCNEHPPHTPAEYRSAAVIRHIDLDVHAAKRVIDQFRGIYFHCNSSPKVSWSAEACGKITEDFIEKAKAAGISYALIDRAESEKAKEAKGQQAGVPLGSELQWTLSFSADEDGSSTLHPELTGTVEMVPGIWSRSAIIMGGDISIEARGTEQDAVGAAKDLITGDMQYLQAVH